MVDFDDAVLGQGLPPLAEDALREAGENRSDESRAMGALMRAQMLAPEHPAVLIALYRHHFYGHRMGPARDVARRALLIGGKALGLPRTWRDVPREPLAGAKDDASVRFFLFTLKGYAYLSLRLNDDLEARDALALLRHLDPQDAVGGALLEAVRQRALVGEPEDDGTAPHDVFGAAAWARLAPA